MPIPTPGHKLIKPKPNPKTRQQMLRILFGEVMDLIPRRQTPYGDYAHLRWDLNKLIFLMNEQLAKRGTKPSELSPRQLADLVGEILDGFNRLVKPRRRVKILTITENIFKIRKAMEVIKRSRRTPQELSEEQHKALSKLKNELREEQKKFLDIIGSWNKS
jgi:hypothetical protein